MKKPRQKKYRPRAVTIPMHAETRDNLALEIHMAIVALLEAPNDDTFNSLSKMITTLYHAGMQGDFMTPPSAVMQRIYECWHVSGAIELQDGDAAILAAAGAAIDAHLPMLNMVSFHNAVRQMDLYCAQRALAEQQEQGGTA